MALSALDLSIIAVPFVIVVIFSLGLRRYMRSVADFLAASRTAGRYLICTASAETGAAFAVAGLQMTAQSGFCLNLWGMFGAMVTLFMILVGFVGYRYRETRVLTFHQFFEVRYSRNLRVFSGLLSFLSGLINFGIAPGVMARFVVYFAGLPLTFPLGPFQVPTYAILMLVFLGFALFYTVSGGQITVMLSDALEGIISGVLYIVVGITIICLFSWQQAAVALTSGPPGRSYINPFDTSGHQDFTVWYVLIGILINIYNFRGISPFSAAAKTAHEAKMAGILGWWRGFVGTGFITIVAVAAFTVLHNPEFAGMARQVETILTCMHESESVQSQMRMPVAIRLMLPDGVRGAFFTIGLFGVIASFGSTLHGMGGGFVQDVILPFRKKPLDPKQHILWLRLGVFVVALFGFVFSLCFTPSDALVLFATLTFAIYGGGAGAVVIGGLYWKKGTSQGAWTAMILGAALALGGRVLQEKWLSLQPALLKLAGPGWFADYLAKNADRCPINSQWMTLFICVVCFAAYILVSLMSCKADFDMDRMLHRGRYAIETMAEPNVKSQKKRFSWAALIGIDEHYTLGDKFIHVGIMVWEFGSNFIGLIVVLLNIFYLWRWDDSWWLLWFGVRGVFLIPLVGFVVVIWLSIGAIRDMFRLLRQLKTIVPNADDDGMVRDHHNLGEPP